MDNKFFREELNQLKKTKSIIAVAALMALLTFAGCGEKDNDMNNTTQTPDNVTEDNYNNGTDNSDNADKNLKNDAADDHKSDVTDNGKDKN